MTEVEKLSYKKIQVIFIRRTDSAVLVELTTRPDRVWIPRTLLAADSDRQAEDLQQLAEWEMRLVDWKADQMGI